MFVNMDKVTPLRDLQPRTPTVDWDAIDTPHFTDITDFFHFVNQVPSERVVSSDNGYPRVEPTPNITPTPRTPDYDEGFCEGYYEGMIEGLVHLTRQGMAQFPQRVDSLLQYLNRSYNLEATAEDPCPISST